MKELINIDTFILLTSKLDIRFGRIIEATKIEKSKKLLVLRVSFGDYTKQIVTNIGDKFLPEQLVDIHLPFVLNLEPTEIMGVKSEGMIIVATDENNEIDLKSSIGTKLF